MSPTKTTSAPSAELRRLERIRDEAHAKVREARGKATDWDAEGEALRAAYTQHRHEFPEQYVGGDFRPKPQSEAAKQSEVIRKRQAEPNPHRSELDANIARFHELDRAANDYKLSNVDERLAELDPDHDAADRAIREGFALLAQGSELYGSNVEATRAILADTPGIERGVISALGFDPRPAEWLRLAREVLDGEVARPGITEYATWKVAQHG